jgi:hydroxymethylbilane synthase
VDDEEIMDMLAFLNHDHTSHQVEAERGFLTGLDGGCQVPIAAWSEIDGNTLKLTGFVADTDGSRPIRLEVVGAVDDAWELGMGLAKDVLASGGDEILREVYQREGIK